VWNLTEDQGKNLWITKEGSTFGHNVKTKVGKLGREGKKKRRNKNHERLEKPQEAREKNQKHGGSETNFALGREAPLTKNGE